MTTFVFCGILWRGRGRRLVGVDRFGSEGDVAWSRLRESRIAPLVWGEWWGSTIMLETDVVVRGTINLKKRKKSSSTVILNG